MMIDTDARSDAAPLRPVRLLHNPGWIVAGIIAFASVLNYVWLSYNATPPHWDAANHLLSALDYREVVIGVFQGTAGNVKDVLHKLVHIDKMVYPPLFPLAASIAAPTLTFRSLAMVNCLFLAVLLVCVYQIGRRIHSDLAGVLGAALIAAYPMVSHLSRDFMVDFSLLAMTGLSAFLIVASNEFRSPRLAFLFGATTTFGLLAKPTYASFIAVPAVFTLLRALYRTLKASDKSADLRGLLSLAAGLALAVCVTALWYIPNWETVRSESVRIANSNPIGFDVFDASALVYYINVLMMDQIGLPFMALFIFAIATVRRYLAPSHFWFLLSWLLGMYALATLAPYKGTGQDIAMLIPISVISAVGLAGLSRHRGAWCTVVLLFAATQAIVFSFPESVLAARIGSFRWAGAYHPFPEDGDWQYRTALRSLGTQPLTLRVMSDDMHVNGITTRYYVRSEGLPFEVIERYGAPADQVSDADVVMLKSDWTLATSHATTRGRSLQGVDTASLGVMYTRGNCDVERPDEPLANRISAKDQELSVVTDATIRAAHPYVKGFPLPDGSELTVYSKRPFPES